MNNEKLIYVGDFEIKENEDLLISDPCYDDDCWCRNLVKSETIKKGVYSAFVVEKDYGDWGLRIKELIIANSEYLNIHDLENSVKDLDFCVELKEVGVDAGLCGFFVNKPSYNREEWYKICDFLYPEKHCINYILATKDNPFMCNGVCSSSGFGDGSYRVLSCVKNGLFIGFKIIFVEE